MNQILMGVAVKEWGNFCFVGFSLVLGAYLATFRNFSSLQSGITPDCAQVTIWGIEPGSAMCKSSVFTTLLSLWPLKQF